MRDDAILFGRLFKQSSAERIGMILEGDLIKTFLFLSIPGLMMVIIQSVMPIIDSLIVYNFDSTTSGPAISYVSQMHSIFVNGAQGLAVVMSAMIGQANGSGDFNEGRKLSGQLMALSGILGLLLIPMVLVAGHFLSASVEPVLRAKIITYNLLLSISLPLMLIQSSFNSIKNVCGHPEITFMRMLLFVPTKLFFTFIFVAVLEGGIEGAALSTICAYALITLFVVYDMFIKKSDDKLRMPDLKLKISVVKRAFRLGWPAMLQNSTKSLSFFIVKQEAFSFGAIASAGQSIAGEVNSLFQSFTCCYDAAIISFVSVNIGAGNGERAKKSARFALKIGVISSIALSLLSVTLGRMIIGLYTSDPEITAIALRGNYILAVGVAGFAIMFNEMPAFIGLNLTKASFFIQTMRMWVIRLAVMYGLRFFFPEIGIDSVFISASVANVAGGIISHIVFRKVKWKKRD